MAKEKIAILGGGIAGLTAAYHLSKTPQLRARYDVTIYQMGWKLGGKLSSGRDKAGRNIEHGLHVWFGCYDNTFRMFKELYAAPSTVTPFASWRDAIKPQTFTPIGIKTDRGWTYWPLVWPSNNREPGEGNLSFTLWGALTHLLGWLRDVFREFLPPLHLDVPARELSVHAPPQAHAALSNDPRAVTVQHVIETARASAAAVDEESVRGDPSRPNQVLGLLTRLQERLRPQAAMPTNLGTIAQMVRELVNVARAFLTGIWRDLIVPDRPFESLDGLEFRAWLVLHGADPEIVATSSIVRAIYDTAFQYSDGDASRPDYAAGTAAGVIVRLLTTFKGDMLWLMQAGMGEAFISPLYDALLAAGVTVRFFHKVGKLELSPDGRRIERIRIRKQADFVNGVYEPRFDAGGFRCWSSEPDWAQLVGGDASKAAGVDFECHWSDKTTSEAVLSRGADFDKVVLAMSLGAYKPLNDEDSPAAELIAANSRFADFVHNIPIVPTQSVQLWSNKTTEELGWQRGKPAAVCGPEYLNTWADMSQVLEHEEWPTESRPKSLHYLTGTFPTALYKRPAAAANTPKEAAAALRESVIAWLQTSASAGWRDACNGSTFRWDWLHAPDEVNGDARLDAQYLRLNINPAECCVGSATDTSQFRLGADESGFDNLFLAGEAVRNGANTTSVEGSVMTGMAAARAISGEPSTIVGLQFLSRRPSQGLFSED